MQYYKLYVKVSYFKAGKEGRKKETNNPLPAYIYQSKRKYYSKWKTIGTKPENCRD